MDATTAGPEELGGFRPVYGVELLYIHRPTLRKDALLNALLKRCASAVPLDGDTNEGLLAFVHPDHVVECADGKMPVQTFVTVAEQLPSGPAIEAALQQSWKFPEARQVVAACTTSVLVTDLMSSTLPYRERFDLFSKALLSVLEVAPADAIHWGPTQQIVDPTSYVQAAGTSDDERFSAGAVNVRLFNISGSEGEILMDTLGLAALGLPDLQCHFRDLEPNDVARLLYSVALYLFENGDVIATGHTVEGIVAGSRWRCQHEVALVGPDREVIDLDPGVPFAAGARGRTTA